MTERQRALQIRRLEACLAKPENRECFDCCALRPRWASTNLGIFICMRCAGIHRSLGVHISKVKSINMDIWEDDMMRSCETVGNGPVGKFKYEANLPAGHVKPKMNTDDKEVERQIRLKFESKLYYPRPDQRMPEAAAAAVTAAGAAATVAGGAAVKSTPPPPAVKETPMPSAPAPQQGGSGKVVQAVAVDEPDLFGDFAQARAGQSNAATDFFGGGGGNASAAAAAPPARAVAKAPEDDLFGDFNAPVQQAAPVRTAPPAPQQQQRQVDFFGAAAAPQPARPDFFGGAQSYQQQQQPPAQQYYQQPPAQQHYQQPPAQQHYQQPPLPPQQQQQQQQQFGGQMDFFGGGQQAPPQVFQPAYPPAPSSSSPGRDANNFNSMYRGQDPAAKQAPVGPDPFAALATERPKTPPKGHAQPQRHQQHTPSAANTAAAMPPAKKPAASLDDLFA